MSYKRLSIISLVIFGLIGAYAYFEALSFPSPATGIVVGSGYYPKLLSLIMVITSIIGIITTVKGEDRHIEFPNMKYFIAVFISIILMVAGWQLIGGFLVWVFIVTAVLIFILDPKEYSIRKIYTSVLLSLILTTFVYVVFNKILRIGF